LIKSFYFLDFCLSFLLTKVLIYAVDAARVVTECVVGAAIVVVVVDESPGSQILNRQNVGSIKIEYSLYNFINKGISIYL
jgi:hypothetical protein